MIQAVIMDFDGTLADTFPDLCAAINRMRDHYGYPPISADELYRFVNCSTLEYVQNALPADFAATHLNEAYNIYLAGYANHNLDLTKPYTGITELLKKLRADGVRLAVMSNKDNKSVRVMTETLFPGLFDTVWGTVSGVPVKPDPARALLIADEFSLPASAFAYIGDSDTDMRTACNAKMAPVAVTWGYRDEETLRAGGAQYFAHTPQELYEILRTL